MFTARESMSPLTTGTTGGKEKEDQSMLALVTDYNATDGGGKEEPPTLAVVANNAAEDYDAADRKVKEKPPTAVVAANNAADKKVEERTLADILKDPRERDLKKESEQWRRPPHDGHAFVLDIFRLCIECNEVPSTHFCRKCKQRVCSRCCIAKRNLEMVWWCAKCFANESDESQAIIRTGDYVSDCNETLQKN